MVLCALMALPAEGPAGQPAPGPDAGPPGGAPRQGGTYRRPLENDPVTLDPALVSDIYAFTVIQQIFDGLVQFGESAGIRPCLAQSWKSSRDGLTWTFQLRRGVKFHHGREMTADDVIYSFTRLLDPHQHARVGVADFLLKIRGAREVAGGRAARLEGLRALDPYTVEVVLTEPSAQLVPSLGVAHTKIVPREVVERLGARFGAEPVGTGPFKFLEWQRNQRLVLAANPDYFGGRPHVNRLEYRVFPGLAHDRMLASFERGELEDSPIPASERKRFLGRSPHQVVQRPILGMAFLAFNTAMHPFDNPKVRQAIGHAIDRAEIVRTINQGRFAPGSGILP
ncbi:MAG TPA: ABC transporter substrate-binding protein, partial [Candidatus Methylomirabilis sp.]